MTYTPDASIEPFKLARIEAARRVLVARHERQRRTLAAALAVGYAAHIDGAPVVSLLNVERLHAIAAWCNTHDDGTAQPRAALAVVDGTPCVQLRSTEYPRHGPAVVSVEYLHSLAEARAALGY